MEVYFIYTRNHRDPNIYCERCRRRKRRKKNSEQPFYSWWFWHDVEDKEPARLADFVDLDYIRSILVEERRKQRAHIVRPHKYQQKK